MFKTLMSTCLQVGILDVFLGSMYTKRASIEGVLTVKPVNLWPTRDSDLVVTYGSANCWQIFYGGAINNWG